MQGFFIATGATAPVFYLPSNKAAPKIGSNLSIQSKSARSEYRSVTIFQTGFSLLLILAPKCTGNFISDRVHPFCDLSQFCNEVGSLWLTAKSHFVINHNFAHRSKFCDKKGTQGIRFLRRSLPTYKFGDKKGGQDYVKFQRFGFSCLHFSTFFGIFAFRMSNLTFLRAIFLLSLAHASTTRWYIYQLLIIYQVV